MIGRAAFRRFEKSQEAYKRKKEKGICTSSGCRSQAIEGIYYCLEHRERNRIKSREFREERKKEIIVKPKKDGFNELRVRCTRCKVFFKEKDGHICPERF